MRWREGSWKEERAIVQLVIHPNGGALPSHPFPRVLREVKRQRRLEKWGVWDRAPGEPGPYLFQILASESSWAYLKHTQKIFLIFVQLFLNTSQQIMPSAHRFGVNQVNCPVPI